MFGLSSLYTSLLAGAAMLAVGAASGSYVTYKVEQGTIAGIKLADAQAQAAAVSAATAIKSKQDATVLADAVSAADSRVRIVTQAATITKEIPVYVTKTLPCVTFGFVRVLNAAAAGVDPAGVAVAPGEPNGACSPVSWDQVAADIADDYGTGLQNADQMNRLEADVTATHAVAQPSASK